jgi:hypothetical protein
MEFIWLYQLPNWALGVLVSGFFTLMSLIGLTVIQRWVRTFEGQHNDLVGAFANAVGVIYAVLLAMIAVAAWTNYTTVGALVSEEADLVNSLFRDVEAYPVAERDGLRLLLREYVDTVINTEWPATQQGRENKRAALVVDAVFSRWLSFEPTSESQKMVVAEMFGRLNNFVSVRQHRIQTGVSGLDAVLWVGVTGGAILTIGLTSFFKTDNQRLHRVLTAALGFMIGMVVYLILALDHPLWGEVSVRPTAFEVVAESMDRTLHPLTPGERRLFKH